MRSAANAMNPASPSLISVGQRTTSIQRRLCLALLCALLTAASGSSAAKDVDVRFIVAAPQPPATQPDAIYVSLSLDDWPEAGRPLKKIADGLYELRIDLQAGSAVSYKFMREPSWATVEKDPRGHEVANRDLVVVQNEASMIVFNDIATWADQTEIPMRRCRHVRPVSSGAAAAPSDSTRVGEIRQHPTILNEKTGEIREVHVYLPPDYEKDPKRRYPVLYMHDGQNVFDSETAFGGAEWELDELLERSIRTGDLPPMIVVAIYNTAERVTEYSPFVDATANRGGGGAKKYLSFVVDTIKPVVDKTYRTLPERENTLIGGASLGGTVSLVAAFEFPKTFGTALVLSPAVNFATDETLRWLAAAPPPGATRIWIDIGTEEGKDADARAATLANFKKFVDALKGRADSSQLDIHAEEIPGGAHHETAWRARMGRILKWASSRTR